MRFLRRVIAGVLLAAPVLPLPAADPGVDFLRDVRPILSGHCFKCHGPDENARKAGLRLDEREAALRPARSGERALVPGRVEASELMRRIRTTDAEDVMPPPSAKNPLTAAQVETLRRWVEAGAEYQPHRAFVAPVAPPIPAVRRPEWVRNPIDAFVLARLEREGLAPGPEADRYTLARRVALDLTGLPLPVEDADAFAADPAPDAYERLVDRLLGSPHYGERWARRWLDLARYADTNGYEKDRPRSIWPWRDWVIRALNADMPFDRFTREQLAGDLLPGAGVESHVATGFLRNSMLNEEGGIDPLEYRFHAMVDRVHTTATTWLGLTVACAQCHSHKYDPISQREYYQFMAFLDNADEPTLEVPRADITARQTALDAQIRELEAGLAARFPPEVHWREALAEPLVTWSASGNRLEPGPGGELAPAGAAPEKESHLVICSTPLTAVSRLRLEVLAAGDLPHGHPGRAESGNFVLSEVEILALSRDGRGAPVPVRVARAQADHEQPGFLAAHAVDGKRDTGWAVAGDPLGPTNRAVVLEFAEPVKFPGGAWLAVRLIQDHGARHALGRFRLAVAEERPDPRPLGERRRAHREAAFAAWGAAQERRMVAWEPLRPAEVSGGVPYLEVETDGAVFASGDFTKRDVYRLRFEAPAAGVTALRLEVLPDPRLPRGGPGTVAYEGPEGDFWLSEIVVRAGGRAVPLAGASHSFAAGENGAARAIDGDPQSGWSVNGGQGRRHEAVFRLAERLGAGVFEVELLFERYYAAALGRFRVAVTTDSRDAAAVDLPEEIQGILRRPAAERTALEQAQLAAFHLGVAPELTEERRPIEELRRSRPTWPTTLVLRERPPENPRATFFRHRGEFLQPREQVEPGLPAALPGLAPGARRDRLGLADWLVSRTNPLTARVAVNRAWAAFFGAGLVRTAEDFGFQGELPAHPELLDWLAVRFMDDGWSMKRVHRLIALSATYRQSAAGSAAAWAQDPQNRLLARGPRARLDAELLRDQALRVSGLLVSKVGGPSVFPPQPAGVTTEGAYGPLEWKTSTGDDRYRRGLYTFAKRTAPFAMFATFDAPSGEACVARRDVSNTPLQALTLLNDPVFTEAAQALGALAAGLEGDAASRARWLFRRCLIRAPGADELAAVIRFYEAQRARLAAGELPASDLAGPGPGDPAERAAWAMVARVLLNLDETVTKS